MDKVSVIIPARNEQFLSKTIECVLAAAEEEVEVIAVCDGYWPDPQVMDDPRVVIIHHTEAIGQRQSINEAAKIATGKFMGKLDAHCNIAPGFDRVIKEDCKYEWTMVPRMHNLEITTFEPKFIDNPELGLNKAKVHDYMYISSPDHSDPLRAMYFGKYAGISARRPKSNDKLIDETMCCMGPGWFMWTDRFWELGGCDEGHGGWGQQGVEVSLKAWLSGGALMVNKKIWFSHWFRGGGVPDGFTKGFPYKISGRDVNKAQKYSRDLWLNNKWDKQTRPLEWLVDKFKPPTWDMKKVTVSLNTKLAVPEDKAEEFNKEEVKTIADFNLIFHRQWNKYPRKWLGTKIIKYPTDLFIYQMIITANKPDFIIETGAFLGGAALFFASMCEALGHGQVIGIDKRELRGRVNHPRITYIVDRSTSATTLEKVREIVKDGSCMIVLDSDHRRSQVKRELYHYSKIVTKDQYLVAEDTMLGTVVPWRYGKEDNPKKAVDWFMARHGSDFVVEPLENRYMVSMNPGGWLKKVK